MRAIAILGALVTAVRAQTPNPQMPTATAPVATSTIRFVSEGADSVRGTRAVGAVGLALLQRTINLELHAVSRDVALLEIGHAAGANVAYAADLVPKTGTVTFDREATTVEHALERALAGVAVDVVIGNGTVSLIARGVESLVSIDGTVVDSVRHTPVRLAAVRLAAVRLGGRGETVLTDDAGRFHFAAAPDAIVLDIRRVGFRPASIRVDASHASQTVQVAMTPGAIGLPAILVTAPDESIADEAGRRTMMAALARRAATRASTHSYAYEAHLRLLEGQSATSLASAELVVAREAVVRGYWEGAKRAQQTLVAQRRAVRSWASGGIALTTNQLHVLSVVAFDGDGWTILGQPDVPLPSPIARNALDHYRFSVIDTTAIDGRRAIRLAIVPRANRTAAFDGIIDVADSTFDILNVRVGLGASTAASFSLDGLQLDIHFDDVGRQCYMPVAISTTVHARSLASIPMTSEYVASIAGYRFDVDRPSGAGVFKVVVAPGADRASDDIYLAAPTLPPLPVSLAKSRNSATVQSGPAAVDSIPAAVAWNEPDQFQLSLNSFSDVRFNRVDGWSYAASGTWERLRASPSLTPMVRIGHLFGSDRTVYRVGDEVVLSAQRRATFALGLHDETLTPELIAGAAYNPTLGAIVAGPGADAQQYFRERGIDASLGVGLIGLTQLSIGYRDVRQSTLAMLDRYARRGSGPLGLSPIANRGIDDGRSRSVSASVAYDSRPLLLESHRFERLDAGAFTDFTASGTFTRVSLAAERSSPAMTGGDFDYRRYQLRVERRSETWMLGSTDVLVVGGLSGGRLPFQRLFTATGGSPLPSADTPFSTMGDSVFGGSRAAAIVASHELDRATMRGAHLPLLSSLPISFTFGAAALWTDAVHDRRVLGVTTPYTEVGTTVAFSLPLANHVPGVRWLAPNTIALHFGEQLSRYDTERRRITLQIRRD